MTDILGDENCSMYDYLPKLDTNLKVDSKIVVGAAKVASIKSSTASTKTFSSSTSTSTSGHSNIVGLNKHVEISTHRTLPRTLFKSNTLEALFIGNLDKDVTEKQLETIFSVYPSFISAKVCYNSSTNLSLGHGYLNFGSKEDAEKACEEMNYSKVLNNEIRIMPSMRDPDYRKKVGTNVYFRNLPTENNMLTTRYFYDSFRKYGKILSCKIERSKKIGFIYFACEVTANEVIKKFNNSSFLGNNIYCGLHFDKEERNNRLKLLKNEVEESDTYQKPEAFDELSEKKFLVKNLPFNVAKFQVEQFLDKIGVLASLHLLNKESKGETLAYVTFKNLHVLDSNSRQLKGIEFKGKILEFVPINLNKIKKSNILYLSNLCVICDSKFLKQICMQEGVKFDTIEITTYDPTSMTYSGFIKCKKYKDTEKLFKYLDGKLIGGCITKVTSQMPINFVEKSSNIAAFNECGVVWQPPGAYSTHTEQNVTMKYTKNEHLASHVESYSTEKQKYINASRNSIMNTLKKHISQAVESPNFPIAIRDNNLSCIVNYIVQVYWNGNLNALSHFLSLIKSDLRCSFQLRNQISEAIVSLGFKN
ncbi:hypothetical protein KAFR_0C04410 [Kazachstania africana CBS 2517]|uniref:RRM domain-containing protein n=1 Tax=Kazachstania africana (strain ATCC 22294 / BCRC 22015 / CBS 2517 / CECT 1963 / NBRC 1671 / NRRL Y-8276) TaxID=1071382 RepID=H2AST1_KAZAF|nr:hypothetical protein KAFR_0C04410 [Kazachstania africana CBS 2517]CCF57431.1 hypothetical protein KAFR_0C04410 [Kazachstania africana CBS 2517]